MKYRWIFLAVSCLLFLSFGQASASYMYGEAATVAAPDVPVTQVEKGVPFTFDITMENDFGLMLGGSMPLAFYGDDGITAFTHVDIGGISPAGFADNSILAVNGWDDLWPLMNQWEGFSWDGNLADTVNWSGLTLMGWMPEGVPTKYLKFGFQIDNTTKAYSEFCIDSVSIPDQVPPGKFDWLFDDPNFTFNGPYCVTIHNPDIVENNAPVLAAIGNKIIAEAANLNFGVSATDTDGDALTLTTSTLPVGASFTDNGNGTGTFNWTPDYEQAAGYPVTFTVSDGTDTDDETITITVNNTNRAPVLASIGSKSVDENVILNFAVSATDPDGTTPTITAAVLPAGATFDGTTFNWIPTYDQADDYDVTFTASDGDLEDSETITITVNNINRDPVLDQISTGPESVPEGDTLILNISTSDPDGTIPILTAGDVPINATFTDNGDGTGQFVFTPDYDQAGTYYVTFTASDGELEDSEVVMIEVTDTNRPPVLDQIATGPVHVNEGESLLLGITASDPDGSIPLILYSGDLPENAVLIDSLNGAGSFTFNPDYDQEGTYYVTIVADDGELTDDETVMIIVDNVNRPPVLAEIGDKTVDEGVNLNFTASATDPDGTTPTIIGAVLPDGATFDGTTFNWTPTFEQADDYDVTFTASDGDLEDTETITITVNDVAATVQLVADPTFIQFTIDVDDTLLIGNLDVTELSGQNVGFYVSNSESWLFLDTMPLMPVITPESIPMLAISVGLEPGLYTDSLMVYWYEGGYDSLMIPVQMTVETPITIMVQPDHFDYVIEEGGWRIDTLDVYEYYDKTVPFHVSNSAGMFWLDVWSPSYDATPAGIEFIVYDSSLDPGVTYYDTIWIHPDTDGVSFTPIGVPVSVTTTAPTPVLAAYPDAFTFTMYPDENSGIQYVLVVELGGGNIPFRIDPMLDEGWLITDSLQDFVTPDSAYFVVASNGLTPGIYSDTLVVTGEGADTVLVPVVLFVEEPVEPIVATGPTMFNWTMDQGDLQYDSLHVYETHGMNVPFQFMNNESWLVIEVFGMPPYNTPYTLNLAVNTIALDPGSYVDTIVIYCCDSPGVMYPSVAVPVFLTVEEVGPETDDSVWVSTVPGVPGNDVVVPVYFRNFETLSGINLPLTWSSDAITLNEVTFDGTEVEYVDNKPVAIDNASRRVQIGIVPTFVPNIEPSRGLLAKLHFSIDHSVTEALVTIDTTSIFPSGGLAFIHEGLEIGLPTFIYGSVVIDTASGFICGRVIDDEVPSSEIEGATVELWDDFPGGGMMLSEMTNINGQFACHTTGISPFDVYAYKEGYYPGLVEDIPFGEIGVEIVLSKVPEVIATPEWVDFYCDDNFFYGVPLPIGSVVDAYDPDGVHCGTYFVSEAGSYGFMPVYRDDPFTIEDDGAEPGDEISFFINGYPANAVGDVIWTENGDNFQVCLDVFTVEDRCLELVEGWNLISWNVDTPADNIDEILTPISNCIDVVLGFEQGGLTYDPDLPLFSTLWSADHLSGYWIKMSCAATLCVTGVPVSETTPINLNAGWNLVSYLPNVIYLTPEALASIHDDYLIVALGFNGAAQTYDPTLPDYSTLDYMGPGFGYWLNVNADATLTYPGSGPVVSFRQTFTANNTASAKIAAVNQVTTSRIWMDIYTHELILDGQRVPTGTEVSVVTAEGRMVGAGIVEENGKFGFVPVYGDDPATETIEGVKAGEEFILVINGVESEESFSFEEAGARVEIGSLNSRTSGELLPIDFALGQNYPNPFNPTTTFNFSVPSRMNATIEIYNILGKKITTLFDGVAEVGTNTVVWDGTDDNGQTVSTGVYFYRMNADDYEETRKMVLMK